MQATVSDKLTALDFVYVYEPGIGETWQNCAYMIVRCKDHLKSYSATYRGREFNWDLTFEAAIDACARFEARRHQEAK